MKRTKELLKQFEELEMRKNRLAEEHHHNSDKRLHFHALEQIVMGQLNIFEILKKRIDAFQGNPQFKKDGLELFNIIEHHLHLEYERIHAKDLEGVYDLVEQFNKEWSDCMIVDYLLNLGEESHFEKALANLEKNRVYSFLRPKILGLAVALMIVNSSFGSQESVKKNLFKEEDKLEKLANPFDELGVLILQIYHYNVHLNNGSNIQGMNEYESHKNFALRIQGVLEVIDGKYTNEIGKLPKELVSVIAMGRKNLNIFLNAERHRV